MVLNPSEWRCQHGFAFLGVIVPTNAARLHVLSFTGLADGSAHPSAYSHSDRVLDYISHIMYGLEKCSDECADPFSVGVQPNCRIPCLQFSHSFASPKP